MYMSKTNVKMHVYAFIQEYWKENVFLFGCIVYICDYYSMYTC